MSKMPEYDGWDRDALYDLIDHLENQLADMEDKKDEAEDDLKKAKKALENISSTADWWDQ